MIAVGIIAILLDQVLGVDAVETGTPPASQHLLRRITTTHAGQGCGLRLDGGTVTTTLTRVTTTGHDVHRTRRGLHVERVRLLLKSLGLLHRHQGLLEGLDAVLELLSLLVEEVRQSLVGLLEVVRGSGLALAGDRVGQDEVLPVAALGGVPLQGVQVVGTHSHRQAPVGIAQDRGSHRGCRHGRGGTTDAGSRPRHCGRRGRSGGGTCGVGCRNGRGRTRSSPTDRRHRGRGGRSSRADPGRRAVRVIAGQILSLDEASDQLELAAAGVGVHEVVVTVLVVRGSLTDEVVVDLRLGTVIDAVQVAVEVALVVLLGAGVVGTAGAGILLLPPLPCNLCSNVLGRIYSIPQVQGWLIFPADRLQLIQRMLRPVSATVPCLGIVPGDLRRWPSVTVVQ